MEGTRLSARLFVPGRIEVLGKHTDYAGGAALLAAVDRGFTFEADPADDGEVVVRSEDSGEEVRRVLSRRGVWTPAAHAAPGADPGPVVTAGTARAGRSAGPDPGWSRYVDAVLSRAPDVLSGSLRGARLRFRSTLPPAAGLSSSSALVTGVFLALYAVCDGADGAPDPPDPAAPAGASARSAPSGPRAFSDREAVAAWLSDVERGRDVGTRGGSEDHVAILCARGGEVVRYRLAPVRFRGSAPVPDGWIFAVGTSGVAAEKGAAARARFNRLSDLAADAARAWAVGSGRADPDPGHPGRPVGPAGPAPDSYPILGQALHAGGGTAPVLGEALDAGEAAATVLEGIRAGAPRLGLDPGPLLRRAGHFMEEVALVDDALRALRAGDVAAFADAANHSAAVGAALLENQVPETLALARAARSLGAPASSPFGAGFGGAVWALVQRPDAAAFLASWERAYRNAFPGRVGATFFVSPAAAPAG